MPDTSRKLIDHFSRLLIERSGYTGDDFADGYDRHRPAPPTVLLDVLAQLCGKKEPGLVVDFGSGTGLSTRPWAGRAKEAVGIEPTDQLRAIAEAQTDAPNVRYVEAYAQATGLPDGCADVVTCSQSLHWMEPEPTFEEAARILRPGGVFAAYDYDWPPVVQWEVDAAFSEMMSRIQHLRAERGYPRTSWRKEDHLARIEASGHFRFAREAVLSAKDEGTAERLLGMALSLGPLVVLLEEGVSEEEVGFAALREATARALGDRMTWFFLGYRIRLAVK